MNWVLVLIMIGIFGFLILMVVAIFGGVLIWARSFGKELQAVWQSAADELGLDFINKGGDYTIEGTVDGVRILVDMPTQQRLAGGPDQTYTQNLPWTRVRGLIQGSSDLRIMPNQDPAEERDGLVPRPSGDPELDEIYRFFADPNDPLNLPPIVLDALKSSDPKVFYQEGSTIWLQGGIVKDQALLVNAINACAKVGKALKMVA